MLILDVIQVEQEHSLSTFSVSLENYSGREVREIYIFENKCLHS